MRKAEAEAESAASPPATSNPCVAGNLPIRRTAEVQVARAVVVAVKVATAVWTALCEDAVIERASTRRSVPTGCARHAESMCGKAQDTGCPTVSLLPDSDMDSDVEVETFMTAES